MGSSREVNIVFRIRVLPSLFVFPKGSGLLTCSWRGSILVIFNNQSVYRVYSAVKFWHSFKQGSVISLLGAHGQHNVAALQSGHLWRTEVTENTAVNALSAWCCPTVYISGEEICWKGWGAGIMLILIGLDIFHVWSLVKKLLSSSAVDWTWYFRFVFPL